MGINTIVNNTYDNQNNNGRFCSVCGRELRPDGVCDYCKLSALAANYEENNKRHSSSSSTTFLVLAIINILVIFPAVMTFGGFWLLFGALSRDIVTYMVPIILIAGYSGASVLGLIGFIINAVKKGSFTGKAFLMTFIGFILGIVFLFGLPYLARGVDTVSTKTSNIEKDVIIYKDDNYILRQKSVSKSLSGIVVTIDVEKLSSTANSIYFGNYISVNSFYLLRNEINSPVDSGEVTFTVKSNWYDNSLMGDINECILFFSYGKNYGLTAKISVNDNKKSVDDVLTKNGYKQALENDYFKVYYKPNTEYHINLYVVSKTNEKYKLYLGKIDANTPGHETMMPMDSYPLYENTTRLIELSYHPCDLNMSYLKVYYSIVDINSYPVSENQMSEVSFDKPQFDKRYCKAKD